MQTLTSDWFDSGRAKTVTSGNSGESAESKLWPEENETPSLRRQRAEAVLLLSKTPVSPRKLSQLAHLADATEARTLVRELNQLYDDQHRAIRIEQVAGGYQMLTRPALAPWLAKLAHLPQAVRLSSPMMETLAVVAYRQPVSRVNVEAVRGVACGELLRQLMERDLIRIAGRAEELGRPYLYGTTKRFLQLFGLPSTDALPPIQWQALNETPEPPDDNEENQEPTSQDMLTSTKESDVSTAVADSAIIDDETMVAQDPAAVIEDEEDDLYEGTGDYADTDDDDEDWGDDDDDWADDDDDDDLDDDDDEDLEGSWEEVDDEDDDEDFDDDDEELDEEEFEGEDWDEEEEEDEDDSEDWDDDEEEDDDEEDWDEED